MIEVARTSIRVPAALLERIRQHNAAHPAAEINISATCRAALEAALEGK